MMPVESTSVESQLAARMRAAEFTSLRTAITTRGTARMLLVPLTCGIWAALAVVVALLGNVPGETLLPLAVLVAGFEAVHALHVGAERIGRYLQVYYEADSDGPQWETTAMTVGPALPGGGVDPLFSVVFVATAALNMLTALEPSPTWQELMIVGGCHVAFVFRIVRARVAPARQRAVELESFRALLLRHRNRH